MGFWDTPCSSNPKVFLITSPRFQAFPLVCFAMEIPSPPLACASQGLWNSALICPSVMLFSLSRWQGLIRAREGGWREESEQGKAGRWWERAGWEGVWGGNREIGWVHQGRKRDSCFVLFYFGFGFLVWVCFWRWGDICLLLNPAPNTVTAKEILSRSQ